MWLYENINDDLSQRASFTTNEITMDYGPTQLRLNPYELYLNGGSSWWPRIELVGWDGDRSTSTVISKGYSCFWGDVEVVDEETNSSLITPTFVSACKGYFGDGDEVFINTDGIIISRNGGSAAELSVIDPEEGASSLITPYSIYSNEALFGPDDNVLLDSCGIAIFNNSGDGAVLRLYDRNINAVSYLSPQELSIGPNDEIVLYVPDPNTPNSGETLIKCDGYIQAFDYQDGEGTSLIARLDSLDSSLGDIDVALDAILAKHVSVLGGGA
jgi:hypothetical protein